MTHKLEACFTGSVMCSVYYIDWWLQFIGIVSDQNMLLCSVFDIDCVDCDAVLLELDLLLELNNFKSVTWGRLITLLFVK